MIKEKTLKEIWKTFNIKNNFTLEEEEVEEEVQKENQWIFEYDIINFFFFSMDCLDFLLCKLMFLFTFTIL